MSVSFSASLSLRPGLVTVTVTLCVKSDIGYGRSRRAKRGESKVGW